MVKLVESAPLPSLIPIRPRNEVALFHACMATLILALEVFIGLEKLEVGDLFGSVFLLPITCMGFWDQHILSSWLPVCKCRNTEGIQHSGLVPKPLAHILSLGFGKEGLGLGLHGATMIFVWVSLVCLPWY